MTTAPPADVAVLGSGPVALSFALFAATRGTVVLAGRPAPQRHPAHRRHLVESVPGPLLTLLLELGVHPSELDVDGLSRARRVAWDHAAPEERDGPSTAHIDHAALVEALGRRARTCRAIRLVEAPAPAVVADGGRFRGEGWTAARIFDATGRRALTARRCLRPTRPWVATCCTVARDGASAELRLAAAADGYAFRLGSTSWLTVGWVGPGRPPGSGLELGRRARAAGAGWLVEDVDVGAALPVRRVANLTVPVRAPGSPIVALGDAALARDALASQGTSTGISDARLAADPSETVAGAAARRAEAMKRHVNALRGVLRSCRYGDEPAWARYTRWVDSLAVASL